MSEAFDILNMALDEAIADAKAKKPLLKYEILSLEIEALHTYITEDIKAIRHNTGAAAQKAE